METDNVGVQPILMTDRRVVTAKVSPATWIGLLLSLLAMVVIRYALVFFAPEITFGSAILKEILIWTSAAAPGYHSARRTFVTALDRSWHSALEDVYLMGPRNRGRVGNSGRRTGLSHRLWTRSRVGCVRETFAVVNHTYRFPGWGGGGIILPRLRHRTFADDWSWTLLVDHNPAGYFFAWPFVRRRSERSHRTRGRRDPDRILFMASRPAGEHDRPRVGGFCC
jgi:hypothetical protein